MRLGPTDPVLLPGENAVLEVHHSLTGGVRIVLKDKSHPKGYSIDLNPQSAAEFALALLEGVGVPINTELRGGKLR